MIAALCRRARGTTCYTVYGKAAALDFCLRAPLWEWVESVGYGGLRRPPCPSNCSVWLQGIFAHYCPFGEHYCRPSTRPLCVNEQPLSGALDRKCVFHVSLGATVQWITQPGRLTFRVVPFRGLVFATLLW